MAGITSYGAYVPLFRVGRETRNWGMPIEKAVAAHDEDSLTMAVAAGLDCLADTDRKSVDAMYVATTTSPYAEYQLAALAAAAMDLRADIITEDVANTLRAGTTALRSALAAVAGGSAKKALVTAADCRMGMPRGAFDQASGDGAAAVMVGDEDVAVEVEAVYSLSDPMLDSWRAEGDAVVRSWEDRMIMEEGYRRIMVEAVRGALGKWNMTPKDFSKVACFTPDAREHGRVGATLGFDRSQMQDHLIGKSGCSGVAHSLQILVSALEEAKAGDRILLVGYGNGADVFNLRVTDKIENLRSRHGIKGHLESKRVMADYNQYLRWRQLIGAESARRPTAVGPSVSALWRERSDVLPMYGTKCKACGYPQYPSQRVCTECQTWDQMESYRFSDKKGTIYTFTKDSLAGGAVEPPSIVTVVDFDGGGRAMLQMTDRIPDEVDLSWIGKRVDLTFRKVAFAGGVHNYFWKCMPERFPS